MQLYNTASRTLDDLPEPPGPVRMYICGPTVYARAHIGNARPYIIGMWLRSWLRAQRYDATLVHNITDINDKIYEAAPGASAELAERATQWYLEDTDGFGLGRPDHVPRATEMIPQIVAFIERLIETGHAYAVDGDVYFRVASFPEYGRLSGQRPDQVEEQEPNPLKEDPRDFALWKANKPGEDTWWDSPWGRGRPGWHIECSVMAEELFGPVFEIHGGGLDLVFPHHENEVAQSRALGREFARIWAHNGMLQFTDAKMSKSIGNVVTMREALDRYGPETLLVFFLTGHWRKPIDFS
ncbi:MAG TPA: cysteine--tRNA ligase, partial [Gaiellaceae bacterium]|nr:cysteine--tRNA ligase [Gaiellaceae bacterium]